MAGLCNTAKTLRRASDRAEVLAGILAGILEEVGTCLSGQARRNTRRARPGGNRVVNYSGRRSMMRDRQKGKEEA